MDKPTFDELRNLAEHHIEGFEKLRAELIEDCIRSSSQRSENRLRGLQFVIDTRRRLASNPVKALLDLQGMMHESLQRLNRALQAQEGSEPAQKARILGGPHRWPTQQDRPELH
ncbi:MAG: DUF3135 domain-containing protein [Marinobacter sp.]|uniref:DUF3135 domain-containing protein n=1 Tax=Marinobacter sp. TaxID=50741 RepID=UPI0034A069B5